MQVPVLLERTSEGGYRAKAWDLVGEGASREEAIAALQAMARGLGASGKAVEAVEFPGVHPFLALAGDLSDEPLTDDWIAAMRQYRERVENDPDY